MDQVEQTSYVFKLDGRMKLFIRYNIAQDKSIRSKWLKVNGGQQSVRPKSTKGKTSWIAQLFKKTM